MKQEGATTSNDMFSETSQSLFFNAANDVGTDVVSAIPVEYSSFEDRPKGCGIVCDVLAVE